MRCCRLQVACRGMHAPDIDEDERAVRLRSRAAPLQLPTINRAQRDAQRRMSRLIVSQCEPTMPPRPAIRNAMRVQTKTLLRNRGVPRKRLIAQRCQRARARAGASKCPDPTRCAIAKKIHVTARDMSKEDVPGYATEHTTRRCERNAPRRHVIRPLHATCPDHGATMQPVCRPSACRLMSTIRARKCVYAAPRAFRLAARSIYAASAAMVPSIKRRRHADIFSPAVVTTSVKTRCSVQACQDTQHGASRVPCGACCNIICYEARDARWRCRR